MNVSIQDTYNLIWKLASVITGALDPRVLETYQLERHPVAEKLMKMDSELVHAYEQLKAPISEVSKIREGFSGFMSGVEVTYDPNVLVSERKSKHAANVTIGMRLPSVPVVKQADGCPTPLARILSSNGAWRLLVFSGNLTDPKAVERLDGFAESFQKQRHPQTEVILIHASPRASVRLLELPEIFHPFDKNLGWDYHKVFTDQSEYECGNGRAYESYGVDKMAGCLVLCRPDQHVAWIGGLDEVAGLDAYFSTFVHDA